MGDAQEVSAPIVSSDALVQAEVQPTTQQLDTISKGCIANALKNLTSVQSAGLRQAISEVEIDLSKARDMIKARRARMVLQKDNLNARKKQIGDGGSRISSLYIYGSPAINACSTASDAARISKQASDLVHARLNEIEYQLTLINASDLLLAAEERSLSDAMASLDTMVLSLR